MTEWWQSMTALQQVLFCVAGTATLITVIQTILMLIGFDGDDAADFDPDAGFDGDSLVDIGGLKLFTFRGIVAGLCIGAWLGFAIANSGLDTWLIILLSVLTMAVTMVLYALAFRAAMKLQSSGNLIIENTIGKAATVYLAIPANRKSMGKVNLTVQERYVELDAVTDDGERIPTKSKVMVTGVYDESTVIVTANINE